MGPGEIFISKEGTPHERGKIRLYIFSISYRYEIIVAWLKKQAKLNGTHPRWNENNPWLKIDTTSS